MCPKISNFQYFWNFFQLFQWKFIIPICHSVCDSVIQSVSQSVCQLPFLLLLGFTHVSVAFFFYCQVSLILWLLSNWLKIAGLIKFWLSRYRPKCSRLLILWDYLKRSHFFIEMKELSFANCSHINVFIL